MIYMIKAISTKDEFVSYFLSHNYDESMFNKDGNLNIHHNSFKKTGLIAQILEDHWDDFYNSHREAINLKRPNAPREVKKVIDCYNKNLGCSTYICPKCQDCIFVGHTCKSRFCSSCGYKYKMERVENILETAYNCNHRHIVFTIPKVLREYFYHPFKERINLLFEAVNLTIDSMFNEYFKYNKKTKKIIKYIKKIKAQAGFFAFLHTFGRDLKWNPHIHVLIAEIELTQDNKCKKHEFFNFESFRKRFQKNILNLLEKNIGKSFKPIKKLCYEENKNGFYVYAEKKKFRSLKDSIEYAARYCGRPPISENRIVNYDGENVTFGYNAHEDDEYHEVTLSALEFIMLLVNHIIPTNFKTIRYSGFYRKKHSMHDKMFKMIKEEMKQIRRTCLKYKMSILKCFNRDPYRCPRCNTKMNLLVLLN